MEFRSIIFSFAVCALFMVSALQAVQMVRTFSAMPSTSGRGQGFVVGRGEPGTRSR